MNDNIEEYLNRGEINYIGRPDLAYTQGGIERINIVWLVNDDPRIEGCTITWNDRENEPQSISFPIDRSALIDGYMSVTMPLEEGTYVFQIVHTGSKGYPSIITEISGTVYGDNYIAALQPRRINEINVLPDRVEIDWAPADAGVTKVLFTYETKTNEEKTIEVLDAEETKTILTDNKTGGQYSWITYYLPDENALEAFSVPSAIKNFTVVTYLLDKTGWTAYAVPSLGDYGTGIWAIIDGSSSTYWMTELDPGLELESNYMQVDMQNVKHVTKIQVETRYLTQMRILSSLNGTDWQTLGFTYPAGGRNDINSLLFDEVQDMQFIRFTSIGSSSYPGRNFIWEVTVTGYDD
jgi:hypothetical protein